MEILGSIEPQKYVWGTLIMDVVIGIGALVPIFIAALAPGGFNVMQPWLIVIPVAMFTLGWLRGQSFGNVWAKALAIGAAAVLFFAAFGQGETKGAYMGAILIAVALTVLPTAGGIKMRRRHTSAQ